MTIQKFISIFLISLFAVSCSAVQESGTVREEIDIKSELDLFLSTKDPQIETQVLGRLQAAKVSHENIKSIIRSRSNKVTGPAGLQSNLQYRQNGKNYPYALFIPESKSPDEKIPLLVVLHGLGGSGANTIPAWVDRSNKEFAVLCPTYPMGAWWARPAEEMVLNLIDQVREQYNLDSDRIFLSG